MDKLGEVIAALAGKLDELAAQYGADALNTIGFVLQLRAAASLLYIIPFAIALWWGATRVKEYFVAACEAEDKGEFAEFMPSLAATVVAGTCIAAGVIGVLFNLFEHVLDPVVWASVFDPRVAIAAKVLASLK